MHLQFERKNVRLWLFYFYISLSCQPTNAVLVQDGIIGTAYQLGDGSKVIARTGQNTLMILDGLRFNNKITEEQQTQALGLAYRHVSGNSTIPKGTEPADEIRQKYANTYTGPEASQLILNFM